MNLQTVIEQLTNERNQIAAAIAALSGSTTKQAKTGKRKMSAAAKAKIAKAQRKAWKARKAASKQQNN